MVDTASLIKAIEGGKVIGAALDVLENEKLQTYTVDEKGQFDYLVNHPRVLLTPHIAGLTKNSFEKLSAILGEKVLEKIDKSLLLTQNRL